MMSKEKIELKLYSAIIDNNLEVVNQLIADNKWVQHLLHIPAECDRLLMCAGIESKHLTIFTTLLDNIKVEGAFAHNTLMNACKMGHFDVIKHLVANNIVDVNHIADEETPLSLACEGEYFEIIHYLLDNGADATLTCELKSLFAREIINPALNAAIRRGQIAIFETLIARGAQPKLSDQQSYSENCWDIAAAHGQIAMLDYLLTNYPLPNCGLLILPISKVNNPEIIRSLIALLQNRGIDLKSRQPFRPTPLDRTFYLEETTRAIAESGNLNLFQCLFDEKDIEILNQSTFLVNVCAGGHVDLTSHLLNLGLDPNVKDHLGSTPLDAACSTGRIDILRLLLEKTSCDINSVDRFGNTPLTAMAGTAHDNLVDIAKHLIIAGANINHLNKSGYSALAQVIREQNFEPSHELNRMALIDFLLTLNPDVNTVNNQGLTPLMSAVKKKSVPIVKRLLGMANIDLNMTNRKELTAADMADNAGEEIKELFAEVFARASRP